MAQADLPTQLAHLAHSTKLSPSAAHLVKNFPATQ